MLAIDSSLRPASLKTSLDLLWALSAQKILSIQSTWQPDTGAPVFTINGHYTSRGWTEWTQGFQFGCAIIQFDATDDEQFLDIGKRNTIQYMASHVSHIGVHDHGFNNVSTYGNLRRLTLEGRIDEHQAQLDFYELALKTSGAVQAARWTHIGNDLGFIYSFNGPHSLFADTIRSLRALILADQLGHVLMAENDCRISLLKRAIVHGLTTAQFNVYYGKQRDAYDISGRVAHESIFNTNDGNYRCPSTQQGYSPFTTWTRGLAWIMTGYAEQLEFLQTLDVTRTEISSLFDPFGGFELVYGVFQDACAAACDFYIENTPTDGIPYWDTGAPGLANMGEYLNRPSDPLNDHEPVDSSAAAIAVQGLLRFGKTLMDSGNRSGERYVQAGLSTLKNLLSAPYLSTDPQHQGILLHTIYHRPNGWDHVPNGANIPNGEACMWGDYHLLESALLVQRMIQNKPYLTFFAPQTDS